MEELFEKAIEAENKAFECRAIGDIFGCRAMLSIARAYLLDAVGMEEASQ